MSNRTVLVLDSTQISSFLECPAAWQFRHKEHLTLSAEVREDFAMGTYGHKLLEIFYRQKKNGCGIDECVRKAQEFNFDELAPFPLAEKTRESVRQRFNEYWMVYSRNDIEPKIVEEGFSFELLSNAHCLYVLEGRIDILGLFDMQKCFMDHKWQGRRHELYSKAIQFRNYALATGCRLGIINYIRLAKETTDKTFARKVITFTAYELEQWRKELISIYDRIAYSISCANAFNGGRLEQNFGACSGRYGYPCSFTPICEEHNLDVKENIKKSLFKIEKEWKPW